jgi:MipA family protein
MIIRKPGNKAIRYLTMAGGLIATTIGTVPAKAQNHITLGAGAAVVPTYLGSDEMRALPFPVLDIKQGPFFANLADGVGVYVIDTPVFKIGGSVNFTLGYRRRDIPEGVDRLRSTAGARMFASTSIGGVGVTVGATRSIGGTDGTIIDGRVGYPVRATERLILIPSATLAWSNGRQNRGYFGISAEESAASGLSEYRPSSGLSAASFGITANYLLSRRLGVVGSAFATRLLDDAQHSPLVERKTTPRFLLGLTYTL